MITTTNEEPLNNKSVEVKSDKIDFEINEEYIDTVLNEEIQVHKIKLDLHARTKRNKQMDLTCFYEMNRHFFIMSDGGQPIYSRYGDELQNCELLATFSAIMTKFTHFQNTSTYAERIQYIVNDNSTVVFLRKGKLILIALSKRNDAVNFLNSQLEYIYIQLVSIVTADRMVRLEDSPSQFLNALSDTYEIFEQSIDYSSKTLCSLFNSYKVLTMDQAARNRLNTIINENRGEALIGIVLTPYEIVSISKGEYISIISPSDIVLIQNLLFSSDSLKQTESWVPICLPGISDSGYLQLYVNFLEDNVGIVFVTESQEHSYFLKFAEQSRSIYETAVNEGVINNIKNGLMHKRRSVSSKNGFSTNSISDDKLVEDLYLKLTQNTLPRKTLSSVSNDPFDNVKYLICKHKTFNQYFTFRFNEYDMITKIEKQIIKSYSELYDVYLAQTIPINTNNFFYYTKSDTLTHTIETSENYILFATFSLFDEFDSIHTTLTEILKIIKYKESHFFINIK